MLQKKRFRGPMQVGAATWLFLWVEVAEPGGLSALVLMVGDDWMWRELPSGWGALHPKAVQQTLEGVWLGMLQRDARFLLE